MGLNRFCLDAPVVTGLWWILFARHFSETLSWKVGSALFFAVWAIYLWDRLLDYSADKQTIPDRKRLSLKQVITLRILSVITTGTAITFGLQLDRHVWIQAGLIGFLTALYFLLFRKLGKRAQFPAKESLIGFCFAAGVGLPFTAPLQHFKIGGLIILGTLCVLNCLIISQTESHYDRESDPSAWFATTSRSFPFTIILTASLLASGTLLALGLPPIMGGCLILSNLLLGLIFFYRERFRNSIQTICDAALWIPALIGVAISGL